jgi:predicted nucleotidyltransferase component of viral defense system
MSKVLNLSKNDRKALFVLSAEKMGVDPIIIEKDFWVVFALHHLFSSKIPARLVFKGGTSLSKCHDVIKRFSEDIDITISRADLGFDIGYEALMQKSRKSREIFLKRTLPP